jgi:hypothetical protein
MQLGVVVNFDQEKGSGIIASVDGERYKFDYKQGQNMVFGDGLATPQFTGRHEQPHGYSLKTPRLGDPVTFIESGPNSITAWGYARHFIDAVECNFGTEFV